jgi:D-glycero-alpha-D-manno-heptose-7-phosphate kinase
VHGAGKWSNKDALSKTARLPRAEQKPTQYFCPVQHREFAVRAPTRLDFGGGWTDVPPYDVEQGGFVCNIAIARYATVRVSAAANDNAAAELAVNREGDVTLLRAVARKYDLRGARLSLTSDFPVAAGLGGSSAAGVASIAAALRWSGVTKTRAEIAEASRELEILELGIAGGRQDHYASSFGGALGIRFGEVVRPNPIPLSREVIDALPQRCIVVYTGESRISANTITSVMGAYRAGAPAVRSALARMRELAEQMIPALASGDFDLLGRLVGEQWQHQRSLDPAIPTPLIDRMIDAATKAGATGCKALGASGGGCVLMVAPESRADSVRAAVAPMGTEITYTVDTMGVTECQ